ncbi:MAG: T9SS type A sorting domain-containing protein, partial [Bacteroidota bacterium]|nr:T9SS type A sorting domain-containing protein [Bacteroidota bacterium]
INAIILSSHLHENPNDSLGYGLPNFALADLLLTEPKDQSISEIIAVVPNPISSNSHLYVYAANTNAMSMEVYDIKGNRINKCNFFLTPQSNNQINLSFLRKNAIGTYLLKIRIAGKEFVEKVVVIE